MRIPLRRLTSTAVAAIVLSVGAVAAASVVLSASVEQLTAKSEHVVEVSVRSNRTVYEGETGRIWTVARVRVHDALHHNALEGDTSAPDELDVYVPGGRVAGMEQDVSGAAHLVDGARMVLFLWRDDHDRLQVLGEAQGAYLLVRDRRHDRWIARNDTSGLVLIDAEGERTKARDAELDADALRERVRSESRRLRREASKRQAKLERHRREARRKAEQRSRSRGHMPGVTTPEADTDDDASSDAGSAPEDE